MVNLDKEVDKLMQEPKKKSVAGCSKKKKGQILPTTSTSKKQRGQKESVAGCSKESEFFGEDTTETEKQGEDTNSPLNNNSLSLDSITTLTLPTTRCYIKQGGYYQNKLVLEPLSPNFWIYNSNGKKGLAQVTDIPLNEKSHVKGFILKDIEYNGEKQDVLFLTNPFSFDVRQFYNVPSISKVEKFLKGEINSKPFPELFNRCKSTLKEMFDFGSPSDASTCSITIAMSWVKNILTNYGFLGVDGTYAGGKTTIGEIVYSLAYHGYVGGNISAPALVRLVDELNLNVFIDEIDQNSQDEGMMAILRKGQRKGNPYVRCEGKNFTPKAYDVAGVHGYSYRSEIEDAFASRSFRVHTKRTSDNRLAIINTYKKEILKDLADEFFFWYIDNIINLEDKSNYIFNEHNVSREGFFNTLTNDLSNDELKFLQELYGRDNELAFIVIRVSKILGLNLLEEVKTLISEKKQRESASENFYLDELKNYIFLNANNILSKKLLDGDKIGSPYYPKSNLYSQFVSHLVSMKVAPIGTKKYSSFLRDLGFEEGKSIRSQRYNNYPTPCLIFTQEIRDNLGLPLTTASFEVMKIMKEDII